MTQIICHKLVKKTAEEMAQTLYDVVMQDNRLYKEWKEECEELTPKVAKSLFVQLMMPKLIDQARHTLAKMLEGPLAENLKEEITDALIKDNLLRQRNESPMRQNH